MLSSVVHINCRILSQQVSRYPLIREVDLCYTMKYRINCRLPVNKQAHRFSLSVDYVNRDRCAEKEVIE